MKLSSIILVNYIFLFLTNDEVISTGLKDGANIAEAEIKKPLVGIYSMYRKSLTWGDAQIYCESHEGHLATFTKIEDLKGVIEKIFELSDKVTTEYLSGAQQHEFGLDRRYWLGLTDLVSGEGNWVWAGKGLPLQYQNMWYPGQPDHIDRNGKYSGRPEHCGALWNPIFHKGDRRHSLVDQECKLKYYFVCENDPGKIQIQKEYNDQYKKSNAQENLLGRAIGALMERPRKKHQGEKLTSNHKKTKLARTINEGPTNGTANNTSSTKEADQGIKLTGLKDTWKSLPGFAELFQHSESSSSENDLWDDKPKRSQLKNKKTFPQSSKGTSHRSKAEDIDDAELEVIFG